MKIPKDAPTEVGQRVELKGRGHKGEVVWIWKPLEKYEFVWVFVAWDWECYCGEDDEKYPALICSISELRVLTPLRGAVEEPGARAPGAGRGKV